MIDKVEIQEVENGWIINYSNDTILFLERDQVVKWVKDWISKA